MATWRDVRRIALELPGASEERTSSGNAAWTVNKKFFTWERPLRRSDVDALGEDAPSGPVLGLRTADLEMKDALLASNPDVYFTIPHFEGYSAVLIRLGSISTKELKAVIEEAWLSRAGKRAVASFLESRKTTPSAKRR